MIKHYKKTEPISEKGKKRLILQQSVNFEN